MEIERKFLLKKEIAERMFDIHSIVDTDIMELIEQFYTSFEPEVRYRRTRRVLPLSIEVNFFKTIKKNIDDLVREEFEEEIDQEEYEYNKLANKYQKNTIIKTRLYTFIHTNKLYKISIDKYLGKLDGLYVAEVEFDSIEEASLFISPIWFWKEITHVRLFKNSQLAKNDGIFSVVDAVNYLVEL